jgi:NAD+ synthase
MTSTATEPLDQSRTDPAIGTKQIVDTLRRHLGETLKRRGLVVALSGGVDSSVCAALATHAV